MLTVKEVEKTIISSQILSIKCDWCGKVEKIVDNQNNTDITSLYIYFGYGSNYDMKSYDGEICDDCFRKHLKPHMREEVDD